MSDLPAKLREIADFLDAHEYETPLTYAETIRDAALILDQHQGQLMVAALRGPDDYAAAAEAYRQSCEGSFDDEWIAQEKLFTMLAGRFGPIAEDETQ